MYLSTLTFTVFALPLILLIFYLIPRKGKNLFLLLAGLLLYGWSSPSRILLPAMYFCFDYGAGILLHSYRERRNVCRFILILSVVLQLTALGCIRYAVDSNSRLFLPFGISLCTLQGIGYLIGVYRGKHDAEINFLKLSLFLSFFPTLYAGPMISYSEFSEQLKNPKYNIIGLGSGINLFIRGLAEKVVLADTLGYIFRELRQNGPSEMSMLTAWMTVAVFSMYLYFELLGVSDMARGLGKCFGIHLPKNFGQPFFSASVTQFMENWNITHILWFQTNFRHFVFTSTKHRWIKYASLIMMWMLIGIWYGSTAQFLVWGLLIGLLLAMEQLFLGKILTRNYAFGLLYTGVALQFVWVLFFADSFGEAALYWKSMIGFSSGLADQYGLYFFTNYIVFLLICYYIATDLFKNITERIFATAIGKKITALLPLIDCVVLIYCLSCMLYTRTPQELWLHL